MNRGSTAVRTEEAQDIDAAKPTHASIYETGKFVDLCRGPHVGDSGELRAFKLTKIAGAYWRGSEKNKMLTRIYGWAFKTEEELNSYLVMLQEAEKRDHRKLGADLELFIISPEVGMGLPLFLPKGAFILRQIEEYVRCLEEEQGYLYVRTPHIARKHLYETSGHWQHYRDSMYSPIDIEGEEYILRPMNCPHHIQVYSIKPRSYRELPMRLAEFGTVYRYEKSGELFGLTRVRALTQDDCHVFLRADQVETEVSRMLDMIQEVYERFGFHDFWVRISTRDPKNKTKYIGDQAIWNESEKILSRLIAKRGWKSEIGKGEAAFYGPKLDFIFKDVLGREWQLSTIQLDMNLPKRFRLEYTDENSMKRQPVVLHRAILGSTERFLGILIEHYAGAFPLWLSPEQIWILPVSDKFLTYAREIAQALGGTVPPRGDSPSSALRVVVREENETLGKKIREGEMQKIPYLLIVGEKEQAERTISVRKRGKGDTGTMRPEQFLAKIQQEIEEKSA
jgi:threonyl-tRNA synthetase